MAKEKNTFLVPLHLACEKDGLRPAFNYVHFIDDFAYATDGHIAIESSIDYYCKVIDKHNLDGHSIHRDAYALAAKCPTVVATYEGLRCQTRGGAELFLPYANMEQLGLRIPNIPSIMRGSAEPAVHIGIRPKYMAIFDKCLVHTGDSLRFTMQGEDKAILVTSEGHEGQRGVWMPVMLTNF